MASRRVSRHAAAAALAAATAFSTLSSTAYADGSFLFSPFTRSQAPAPQPQPSGAVDGGDSNPSEEDSGGRSSGFDAESFDRAAKALREINNSPFAKAVFDIMRKQERTRLTELEAEKVKFEAMQTQIDVERKWHMAEEQRNIYQQQAHAKAQKLRYDDDLARKRMQADHEAQRKHNSDLVRMQEQSLIRQEKARQATEEQVQAQLRQTEKERALNEHETYKVKIRAEAEGNAHEKKLSAEHDRNMLIEEMNGEREKWLAAINTTFRHIEGGLKELLTDRNKLFMTVGGATALAAGVYTSREGARVTWGYINRILGQPSLIRESSMSRFPWSGIISRGKGKPLNFSTTTASPGTSGVKSVFENVVLHPSLQRRINQLARATANTKAHQAPFRNMLFYGPPGTGKTLVAREIARKSGLDYAMMTGGDVAPLGPQGVTKIHEIFDWAKKSKKGLLLFIDEADAFLCQRNSTMMSEAQRSALNALLFRTGDQSRDIVLVLATNRPGDLDSAVTDRIDEVLEFPLPGEEERYKLLKLYLNKYLNEDTNGNPKWGLSLKKKPQKITVRDLSDNIIREAARKTEGFSGREIAKLVASVQAAVYGRPDCVLDSEIFEEVVGYKVAEHHQRLKLASEGNAEAKKLHI